MYLIGPLYFSLKSPNHSSHVSVALSLPLPFPSVVSLRIHHMIKKKQLEEDLWFHIQTDNNCMQDGDNILCYVWYLHGAAECYGNLAHCISTLLPEEETEPAIKC